MSWNYAFQSTHPHGVRLYPPSITLQTKTGFNPRTRTGCDGRNGKYPTSSKIVSIHAPARGATIACGQDRDQDPVSIHAPARGATRNSIDGKVAIAVSIHAPARGATKAVNLCNHRTVVSIHAPARGATMWLRHGLTYNSCFNPRTRTGCDVETQHLYRLLSEFQSTHPHGVRRADDLEDRRVQKVSIHAPARGATIHDTTPYTCYASVSIHAPARGATFRITTHGKTSPGFQSTHPHGVRLDKQGNLYRYDIVSIHAPARGATINRVSKAT